MAYVPLKYAHIGAEIVIKIRKKAIKAIVTKVPFL
jgi:glycine cleavage system aminomethyltransferase T